MLIAYRWQKIQNCNELLLSLPVSGGRWHICICRCKLLLLLLFLSKVAQV